MILRKIRKLQTGGALNLARNEAAPIDIRWAQLDPSGFKNAPLSMPASLDTTTSLTKSAQEGGLPSDITYAQSQLDYYKNKIKTGLSGSNSADYSNTTAKDDSNKVAEWSKSLVMLKSMAERYKVIQTKAIKAGSTYAMSGGKALVKDATTGDYTIIDSPNILTTRVRDTNGKLRPRYTPATVSEALDLRFKDPRFSGFIDETGGTLDVMLSNTQDPDTLNKDMNDLFNKVGSVDESATTFTNHATGAATSMTEMLKNLDAAKSEYASGSTKSNKQNLEAAVKVFSDNMTPAQKEVLQSTAIAKFIATYGDREVKSPEDAMDWVNAKVASEIADRAAAFLRESTSTKKGTGAGSTGAAGTAGTEPIAKEAYFSKISLPRIAGSGQKVVLETGKYKEATGLDETVKKFNDQTIIDATPVSLRDEFLTAGKGLKPGYTNIVAQNPLVSKLTEDNLNGNFFLADPKSTPVASLGGNNGLNTSAINTTVNGGQSQLLRSMPYRVENGKYSIAWDFIDKTKDWNKKYEELYKAMLVAKKTSHPSHNDIYEVIQATNKATNMDIAKLSTEMGVHKGDLLMIPIVVYDTNTSLDDPDLDEYMHSGVSSEEKALISKEFRTPILDRHVKRTYAFTVLSNDPAALIDKDHYGKDLAMDQKINLKSIEEAAGTAQRMYNLGYSSNEILHTYAEVNPTKPQ